MALTRIDSRLSDLSFASSLSEYDTTSGSSISTIIVPGPGALTGKAVKALGVATLKGFGRIIMARHWATVVHAFPHTDEQAQKMRHINEIYDDLLEFSRPGMYSHDVNSRAMGLILAQIGAGQTRFLIRALTRWHPVELYILLSGTLTQLAHSWNPLLRGVFSSPLTRSYTDVPSDKWQYENPALVLVLFFSKVIRSSARACRVVLDVGYLDFLVSLLHHYLHSDYNLYLACNASLLDITGYGETRFRVASHPIVSLWPTGYKCDLFPFKVRREALLLGPDSDVALVERSPFSEISLVDLCTQPDISAITPDELLHSLVFHVTHDQALRVFLARNSYQEKLLLLSRLFSCLSESLRLEVGSPWENVLWRYQFSFSLHFIAAISRSSPENKRVLLHAGAAKYLVDALRVVMPDSHESAIGMVREHGLFGLLKLSSVPHPPMQQSLLSAISALLGKTPSED
ncbi:hypothetical protein C0993_010464 [Termitomyces sp. T159_Od127]|nr:hypothetical protein C0993_010464 [Termitomyces sp. T159_Od127]